MAQITINEISQNYTYNIGTSSYATVALPITACWGPGYFDPDTMNISHEEMLAQTSWQRFPATQAGLEAFVATYRGPASCYRSAKDFSYQNAMTLLTAGYDVLVSRICPGTPAKADIRGSFPDRDSITNPTPHMTVTFNKWLYEWLPGSYGGWTGLDMIDASAVPVYDARKTYPQHTLTDSSFVKYYDPADMITRIYKCKKAVTAYDKTASYAAGDPVIYENNLYTALSAISSPAGDFDSTKWQRQTGEAPPSIIWEEVTCVGVPDAYYSGSEDEFPGYDEGEYVTYNFSWYRANEDIDEYEPFTAEHWTKVDKSAEYAWNLTVSAKYPGTFGNKLQLMVSPKVYVTDLGEKKSYVNIVTYVVDANGVKSAIESRSCVFKLDDATDSIPYYEEVDSEFWVIGSISTDPVFRAGRSVEISTSVAAFLTDGADYSSGHTASDIVSEIQPRYDWAHSYSGDTYSYPADIAAFLEAHADVVGDKLDMLFYNEWICSKIVGSDAVEGVYDLLKDKLAYNPNRVISPGWDDQNFFMYSADAANWSSSQSYSAVGQDTSCKTPPSPIHLKLMDVAYYGRCATALIDVPHIVSPEFVHVEDDAHDNVGYVQRLARVTPNNVVAGNMNSLFASHSAFFAPWGQFLYVGTGKMNTASPSFLALMIQRAQILNQAIQYEWALPTNRQHNLAIGKLDYVVSKKLLDQWQKLDGASVNVVTRIPDLGVNLWGNSTLYEVPPATYQALANLSTRYLVNAVEDCAYRCGISITFQYNNDQAYNKFYAGVTPLLDTMRNVGAIDDYYVKMAADINGLDQVNANTVIGKIYLIINGVINDIVVDLIALPPAADLADIRS